MGLIYTRQLKRLLISGKDLREADRYLGVLESHPEAGPLRDALLISAVICYARPFSHNQDSSQAVATPSLRTALPPELGELHDQLLMLRNKAIAHSDYEANSVNLMVFPSGTYGHTELFGPAPVISVDPSDFRRLIATMLKAVRESIGRVEGKLEAGFHV